MNQGDSSVSDASVVFMVSDVSNKVVAQSDPVALSALSTGSTSTARTSMKISSPKLWESASPDLYTVTASVMQTSNVVDTLNVSHGVRSLKIRCKSWFS